MTTRKYNAIKKNCYIDGFTFDCIYNKLEKYYPELMCLTAKQIARIIELCYAEKEFGYNECWNEWEIHLKP